MDLKNMIGKQQKFIEDNDVGGSANGDKSKFLIKLIVFIDIDLFLDGAELDFEDQDALEDQYISDFNMDEK